jgi:diacylglycerol kinase (ATP)
LVLGGDGTVRRQLAALHRLHVPFLVVPLGSANDFARALGVRTPRDSLQLWRRFCAEMQASGNHETFVRRLDLGVVNSGTSRNGPVYFGCAAGVGLDAVVARRANALPRWLRSHGGYLAAAIPELIGFRARRITLSLLDGTGHTIRLSEPGLLAAFANAPAYGHGMRIAPRARFDDGELDICFVRPMPRLRLLRLFPAVYRGAHLAFPEVEYFRTARVRVESEIELPVHADGEPLATTPVEIGAVPGGLRVITP